MADESVGQAKPIMADSVPAHVWGEFRDVLQTNGYSQDGIDSTLEDDHWFTPKAIDIPRYLHRNCGVPFSLLRGLRTGLLLTHDPARQPCPISPPPAIGVPP